MARLKTLTINGVTYTVSQSAIVSDVTLLASAWVEGDGFHYQVVGIPGTSKMSQVDLKPSAEQLEVFHDKDIAFVAENEDGIITVKVIGEKPTNDYTMQVSISEVSV